MPGSSSLLKQPVSRFSKFLQSQPYTWSANGVQSVDLSFLSSAKQFAFPMVTGLWIRGSLTVNTGASGGPARCHSLALSNILLRDLNGERVNLRGSSVRVIEHMLQSGAKIDTSNVNIAASQSSVAVEYFWRLPIGRAVLRRGMRRKDFSIPLLSLMDGGELRITYGAANPISGYVTTTAGTFDVFAEVQDYGVPELPPNFLFKDYSITQTEQYVPVNGRLYCFLAYAGEGGEGAQTAWSSHTVTSATTGHTAYPDTVLREHYRAENPSARHAPVADSTTTNLIEDPFLKGQVDPVFFPKLDQPLVDLPAVDSFHYKTSLGSVGSNTPTFIVGSILPRTTAAMERAIPGVTAAGPDAVDVVTDDGKNPGLSQLARGGVIKAPAKDALSLRLTKKL